MRLLLILPLRAEIVDGRTYVDAQACNGLRLWLTHFEFVTLACPTRQVAALSQESGPINAIPGADRLTFVPLPLVHTPHTFALALPNVVRVLRRHIKEADYLHFAIGGLWGDWASVACFLTRRPFSVWTDRVEHQVVAFYARSKSTGTRRLYTRTTAWLMKHYERVVIRRAALGLFHGADTYDAYAKYCRNPHVVHDVHTGDGDIADDSVLAMRRTRSGPLRIAYAGRAHKEKGIFDWLEVLSRLDVPFEAVWFGDGPELESARSLAPSNVSFPGVVPHATVLRELKTFDVFLFCHKTPESPRCLIEALQCGLPIIGYDSPYPRDLIRRNNGGILTPANDPARLAEALNRVGADKEALFDLNKRAAQDGSGFTDTFVFEHRSLLMKRWTTHRRPVA